MNAELETHDSDFWRCREVAFRLMAFAQGALERISADRWLTLTLC
jgi:hypothetical protein